MDNQIISLVQMLLGSISLLGGVSLARLRWLILRAIKAVKGKVEGYHYPLVWLEHFLQGSGQPLEIPRELVEEALWGFTRCMREPSPWEKSQHPGLRGVLEVYHSTEYEGGGFLNRPQLFYLVGSFKGLWFEDQTLVIEDLYDWGAEPQSGQFFCSALPFQLPRWIHESLNKALGDSYYPLEGFPMGEPGVSNQLWFDLQKQGLAKPFLSTFKGKVDLEEMGFETRPLPLRYSGGVKTEYPHAPKDLAGWVDRLMAQATLDLEEVEILTPDFRGSWGMEFSLYHTSSYRTLLECNWEWFKKNLLPLGGVWSKIWEDWRSWTEDDED